MLLSEQLLEESLMLEAMADEANLIFDQPNLITLAKQVYTNADVSVHALYPDERYDWSTSNKEAHMQSIKKYFVKEYNTFAATYNKKLAYVKDVIRNVELYNGSKRDINAAKQILADYKATGKVKNSVTRDASKLIPYAQDDKKGYIACFMSDGKHVHKIVISPEENCIITAYQLNKAEILRRANAFNSVELLSIATYGEIVSDKKSLYYAIKLLDTSPNIETKWLYAIGIKPQTKQTEIHKLEASLSAEPITKALIQ